MSRARKEQSAVTTKNREVPLCGVQRGVASRWSTSSCSHCSAQKKYHEAMGCCPSAPVHSDETQRFSEDLSGPPTQSQLMPSEQPPSELPPSELPPAVAEILYGEPDMPKSADPRWDRAGFDGFLLEHPFVRLGYLRSLSTPPRAGLRDVPESEMCSHLPARAGVIGVQLFAILSPSLGQPAADCAAELSAILALLVAAADDDLLFWHHLVAPAMGEEELYRVFTHYRVQTAILVEALGCPCTVFERLETMAYVALATFCQRLVNDGDVRQRLSLEQLIDLPNTLASLYNEEDEGGTHTFLRVATMLDSVIRSLCPVHTDADGFAVLCAEADIAWLPAPYLMELCSAAPTEGCRPFPRRQDLDPSRLIVGRPPRGRKVVVSHGWDAQFHVSPSGAKLAKIVAEMQRLGATGMEDAIFMDWVSLAQDASTAMPETYFAHNGLSRSSFSGRTLVGARQFAFALTEMSRMYAFHECIVLVFPEPADPLAFPAGAGEPLLRAGDTLRLEKNVAEIIDGRAQGQRVFLVSGGGSGQQITLDASAFASPASSHGVIDLCAADGARGQIRNVCAWGLVNQDAYQRRGTLRRELNHRHEQTPRPQN